MTDNRTRDVTELVASDHPLFARRLGNRRTNAFTVSTSRGDLRVAARSTSAAVKQAQRKLAHPLTILGVREG